MLAAPQKHAVRFQTAVAAAQAAINAMAAPTEREPKRQRTEAPLPQPQHGKPLAGLTIFVPKHGMPHGTALFNL